MVTWGFRVIFQRKCSAGLLGPVWSSPDLKTRRYTPRVVKVICVISGGQLIRIGSPTTPIPRETYICVFDFESRGRYIPSTYSEASELKAITDFPRRPRTI